VVAALFAAAMPALLTRSAIVIVDTVAACLTTASVCCASCIRRSRRPFLWSTLAGITAGLAAGAKYPSGAVVVAPATVIALSVEWTVRKRAALLATAIGGAAAGAVAAAPTIVVSPRQVVNALRIQARIYQHKNTTSYWHELRNPHEVGLLVGILAVVGTVILLRDPKTRAVTIGALAFALLLVSWLARYPYQPFRNLLPVVALVCVASAVAVVSIVDAIAARAPLGALAAPALVAVLAVGISAVMLGSVWRTYSDERLHIEDSRSLARTWLASRVGPTDRVLVATELGFLPRDLDRLRAPRAVRSLTKAVPQTDAVGDDYIVVGDEKTAAHWRPAIAGTRLVASFGHSPTVVPTHAFRPPSELIRIFVATDDRGAGP
jgi:4-amino-4-deoxy-L-arabinose transferase-like glycosyltransferase